MAETSPSISPEQLLLGGMVGMFLLAISIIAFFVIYQKRLLKQQKEHQQKEADYQQQLLRANLLSQEKERNRIGKDLHDEVGAMLTTSKLYFRHLDRETPAKEFDVLKQKTFGLLEGTIATVRRVSHDLRPVVLETLGLVEAIANSVDQLNISGELKVNFMHDVKGVMDKEYQINWYRIIQELIHNTLKHANAQNIEIDMSGDGNHLEVTYQDDGLGLTSDTQMVKGLGLSNIESRISLMNGQLEILKPGRGTKIYLASEKPLESTHNG